MRSLGRVADGAIVQECGAGLLPVVIDGDTVTLTGGAPHHGEPVEPGPLLAAVGLTESDLVGDPARLAGVGIDFGFLHVHQQALAKVELDLSALNRLDRVTGVSVFSYADGAASARVFAADVGEDPATGSAALGLGVWLAAAGRIAGDGETSYVVTQGVEMGRPSHLACVVRCEGGAVVETRVTGTVVPIADGTIRRPAD
jgi:trans-2,3-dihydro-3-hydroxyanthranilate isomerase